MHSHPLVIFFFNDTATTEIYTLSLHDALPISHAASTRRTPRDQPGRRSSAPAPRCPRGPGPSSPGRWGSPSRRTTGAGSRSEEHTSELQSRPHLVCRLLLDKKTVLTW